MTRGPLGVVWFTCFWGLCLARGMTTCGTLKPVDKLRFRLMSLLRLDFFDCRVWSWESKKTKRGEPRSFKTCKHFRNNNICALNTFFFHVQVLYSVSLRSCSVARAAKRKAELWRGTLCRVYVFRALSGFAVRASFVMLPRLSLAAPRWDRV